MELLMHRRRFTLTLETAVYALEERQKNGMGGFNASEIIWLLCFAFLVLIE